MKTKRVLVVDDEPRLVRLVHTVLSTEGYNVVTASEGKRAVEMVALEQPDLVLLDILLPGELSGYDVCRRVREFSDVPVVMLTAKAREEDKLMGFDAGADDYLTKPFSARELLARIKAVLRRSEHPGMNGAATTVSCGAVLIDMAQRRVMVRGREVALTPTEYDLLRQLALNAGKVMLHEDLLSRVWGPEYRDEVDYLRDYIRFLRRKIEEDPRSPRYIVSRPGVGYMMTDGIG
jgi:two-component system, OmpR family, KDP operon response regulator KdpE